MARTNAVRHRDGLALVVSVILAALILPLRSSAQTGAADRTRRITLTTVFEAVRANDPTIAAAMSRVQAARGGVTSARTWSNPVFSFQSEQMSEPMPGMGSQRETMATAMLPLEPLYQRRPRIRSATAQLHATEADALASRQQVALNSAEAFYRLAIAQVNTESTRDLSRWLDTVVTYNQARVKEGVASEADLMRSELERDRVQNELAVAEAGYARVQADLLMLIGAPATSALPDAQFDSLPLRPPVQNESAQRSAVLAISPGVNPALDSVSQRVAMRPDLVAARERANAAEAAIGAERAKFIREIGAMAGVKNSAGQSSLVAGLTIPIPLLDRNQGSVATARAESDAARFDLENLRRRVTSEVIGAEGAVRVLTRRAVAISDGGYLRRADESRKIALGAYREGGTSLLQVIDAAREWREARMSYFETLFAQHQAVLELLVARGVDVLQAWPQLKSETGR